MKTSMNVDGLSQYLVKQLNNNFPDSQPVKKSQILPYVTKALDRIEICFDGLKNKRYFDGEQSVFNHLHSDQYAQFLYFVANSVFQGKGSGNNLATKVYYLNKSLHGIDVYFENELPDIFIFSHCVGSVLGRGNYSNYFHVGQNCTVGKDQGVAPTFDEYVAMWHGSIVVGDTHVGSNVFITPNTFIRNEKIPSDTVVSGKSPNLKFANTNVSVKDRCFNLYYSGYND